MIDCARSSRSTLIFVPPGEWDDELTIGTECFILEGMSPIYRRSYWIVLIDDMVDSGDNLLGSFDAAPASVFLEKPEEEFWGYIKLIHIIFNHLGYYPRIITHSDLYCIVGHRLDGFSGGQRFRCQYNPDNYREIIDQSIPLSQFISALELCIEMDYRFWGYFRNFGDLFNDYYFQWVLSQVRDENIDP